MVLKKFKDMVKGRDEREDRKGDRDRPEPVMDTRSGGRNENREREGLPRRRGSRDSSRDLGIPSERNVKELPDLSERTSLGERSPSGDGEDRLGGGDMGPRRESVGTERGRGLGTPSRDTGRPRSRRPRGSGQSKENVQETLQRVMDKLDEIDRRLQRLEGR